MIIATEKLHLHCNYYKYRTSNDAYHGSCVFSSVGWYIVKQILLNQKEKEFWNKLSKIQKFFCSGFAVIILAAISDI